MSVILVISSPDTYAAKRLIEEGLLLGVQINFYKVEELATQNFIIDFDSYDALYIRSSHPYRERIISLAKQFLKRGKIVVDEAIAGGDLGLGKWRNYQILREHDIPIPQTATPNSIKRDEIFYPFVVKWIYGFNGKEVWLVQNDRELNTILEEYKSVELIVQKYIRVMAEYHVVTIGYESVSAVLKFRTKQSRIKYHQKNYEIFNKDQIPAVVELAQQSSRILKRELAKVDILQDKNGHYYVVDVNRTPGLRMFEPMTGYNVVAEFVRYIENKKSRIIRLRG